MQRSLAKRLWYGFLKFLCRLGYVVACRGRCEGRQLVPSEGGGLVLSNHQSYLDPIIVGLCCDRRLNYVARQTLFRFPPFRWLINSLDAIPIDRDGVGLGGLKETLKRLKRGEMVLLFPEGTRTPDGSVQPMKPGFCAIARRGGVPLIPVAMDGAYQAWPRHAAGPRLSVLCVVWGPPIVPSEIERLSDDELLAEVERRIRACHAAAKSLRDKASFTN